jgi:hypothetical protein
MIDILREFEPVGVTVWTAILGSKLELNCRVDSMVNLRESLLQLKNVLRVPIELVRLDLKLGQA